MPSTFNLPPLEDGATEATIERYFYAPGADVEQGQPLAIVVTKRFEWEIPATAAGTITKIVVQPGTIVAIGAPLLEIRIGSDAVAQPEQRQQVLSEQRATPLARRIAAAHGLSLADVSGSGRGGRIMRNDVLDFLKIEPETTTTSSSPNGRVASVSNQDVFIESPTVEATDPPLSITASPAEAATQAPATSIALASNGEHQAPTLQSPYALTAVEVDLTAVQRYVAANHARWAKRGLVLDPNICVAYAAINALGKHRLLNSAWHDDGIILWRRIDIGWLPPSSYSAPPLIIRNAADLSLQGLTRKLSEQPPAETSSMPTFTIAATTAATWSEPSPTVGYGPALLIGAAKQRPHVVEGHGVDTIKLRPLSILTLSYDARIVEQHQADAFLIDITKQLEHFAALC